PPMAWPRITLSRQAGRRFLVRVRKPSVGARMSMVASAAGLGSARLGGSLVTTILHLQKARVRSMAATQSYAPRATLPIASASAPNQGRAETMDISDTTKLVQTVGAFGNLYDAEKRARQAAAARIAELEANL